MNAREKNYSKALKWIDSLNQNKIVPGLHRITKLMNHLNNPQNKLKIIMVGGTNAKGNTCHNLNYNLNKVGIKTGCYTSPHLHTIRERIRIGNKKISKDKFTRAIFDLKCIDEEHNIGATYFEILTALAYFYFNENKVDYAIMEIGLGGEWDAVNIGNSKIAILTTLGIDHVDYLGHTIEEIATTKAKIVREKSILITGWEKEYHKYIPKCKSLDYSNNMNNWIELVFQKLKIKASIEIISMPGRFERFKNFTLDVAHNEQAMEYLLKKDNDYENIIIGILEDKNASDIIKKLPQRANIMVCNLPTERGTSSQKLSKIARNMKYRCSEYNSVKEAMENAKEQKTLITGSFYTVSEGRNYLELKGHREL
jgi:dihydrofolate synthase/folylpolyglutamate synthase